MNQALLEEPELLTEVPPILKRLAKMTAYGFYEAEHIAIVCLLAVVPCVDEESLLDRLNFDKRQLRQALARLRSDKLVKQRVHKEKQPETGTFNVYNFYFINYKVFVNVVKYKLDHIRKKLESEEQQAKNRPSFTCTLCENKYQDLEVDRLLDLTTGMLKCTFCGGDVEEDAAADKHRSVNKSSLALFNEQMEPIFKLLRACENINLAPEVLEPEPTTVQLKVAANRSNASSSKGGWSNDRKTIDLYDQSISVNVGNDGEKEVKKNAVKKLPVWMAQSTVYENNPEDQASAEAPDKKQLKTESKHIGDKDILSDLLAHESVAKKAKLDTGSGKKSESEDSEPDSEPNDTPVSVPVAVKPSTSSNAKSTLETVMSDGDDHDEDHDEVMVTVGSESIPISKVLDDPSIMERMTEKEHEDYLHVYHKYVEQFY
eukprot:gene17415-9015_t